MIVDTTSLGQDRFRYGAPYGTGIVPGVPFLGQLPEVAGGAVAAVEASASQRSAVRSILIGFGSGMLIYLGHRLVDAMWPRK